MSPGLIDALLRNEGLTRRVVRTVSQFAAALFVASRTDAITVVPCAGVRRWGEPLAIVAVRLPAKLPTLSYRMSWSLRLESDTRSVWVRELFRRAAAQAIADGVLTGAPSDRGCQKVAPAIQWSECEEQFLRRLSEDGLVCSPLDGQHEPRRFGEPGGP